MLYSSRQYTNSHMGCIWLYSIQCTHVYQYISPGDVFCACASLSSQLTHKQNRARSTARWRGATPIHTLCISAAPMFWLFRARDISDSFVLRCVAMFFLSLICYLSVWWSHVPIIRPRPWSACLCFVFLLCIPLRLAPSHRVYLCKALQPFEGVLRRSDRIGIATVTFARQPASSPPCSPKFELWEMHGRFQVCRLASHRRCRLVAMDDRGAAHAALSSTLFIVTASSASPGGFQFSLCSALHVCCIDHQRTWAWAARLARADSVCLSSQRPPFLTRHVRPDVSRIRLTQIGYPAFSSSHPGLYHGETSDFRASLIAYVGTSQHAELDVTWVYVVAH